MGTDLMPTPEQIGDTVRAACDTNDNIYRSLQTLRKKSSSSPTQLCCSVGIWGYGFLQSGQRTDFMKLFGQPVRREAVTHKH